MLVGRQDALARIRWVVSGARAGRGAALLLRGEPGSGKTALLAAAEADGMTVLRCVGTQDERELPYAALHALLRPLRSTFDELVPAQRTALDLALGTSSGGRPAPLLVGAATLALLSLAAGSVPVLVVVDDLQWIDTESRDAIGFAARRLEDDAVGLLIAVRPGPVGMSGIETYELPELDEDEAVALLAGHGVVRTVALRLSASVSGNPLALVELAQLLDDGQRQGLSPLPDPLPMTTPEAAYVALLTTLPERVRVAAAVAGLAGNVSTVVLADALARAGSDFADLATAEQTGLLTVVRSGVTWRHPLARAAAADAVDTGTRRRLHQCVADALLDAGGDSSAVVWHRVGAATGPDEGLAEALDGVASVAAARGAHQAASQAWETAATLGRAAAPRLAAAALEAWAADDAESASRLVAAALPGLDDTRTRWELALVAGQVAANRAEPQEAWDWFMRAVEEAKQAGDRSGQVRALAISFNSALRLDDQTRLSWLSDEIRAAADLADPVQVARASAVQGFALLNAEQAEAGTRLLDQAMAVIEAHDLLDSHPELLHMTVQTVMWAGQPRRMRVAIDAAVARLRAAGETREIAAAVRGLVWCDYSNADWDAAAVRAQDAMDLATIGGRDTDICEALAQVATLEGARGHTVDALAHSAEALRLAESLDSPYLVAEALCSQLVAALSAGDAALLGAPAEALGRLVGTDRVAASQPEYFDAAVALALAGRKGEAAELLDLLLRRGGDDARLECRAAELLVRCALGPDSEALADETAALALRLEGPEYVFWRARVELFAGAMKRRLGHRVDARALLRTAEADFGSLGARPWVAKAQDELRASGATLRTGAGLDDSLTASEERVAAAAAAGMSNKEIAASLFLSGKTVEFHLGRIYRKLGVRSRSELVRVLLTRGSA